MKVDDGLNEDLIQIMSQCGQIRRVLFHKTFLGGTTKIFTCFLQKAIPLLSNDNSILFSFTSKIYH